jgi:hypothetical protein
MTWSVSCHLPSPQGETTLDTWRTNSVSRRMMDNVFVQGPFDIMSTKDYETATGYNDAKASLYLNHANVHSAAVCPYYIHF